MINYIIKATPYNVEKILGVISQLVREDDGESLDFEKGAFAQTMFEIKENGDCTEFIINCAQGDLSVIPEKRNYIISFKDIVKSDSVGVEINGEKADFDLDEGKEFVCINLNNITPFDNVKISLIGVEALKNNSMESEIVKLVSKYQESVVYKQRTFSFISFPPSGNW